MKALVTGAAGFIGRNLAVALRRSGVDVAEIDVGSPPEALASGVRGASVVYHLAGVNRPEHEDEFRAGNVGSLAAVCAALDASAAEPGALVPLVVLSSSTQAATGSAYGRSKLAAEHALETFSARAGAPVVIYRLPGVFGKW